MKPIEELRKLLLGEWAHRFNLADAERINAILAQPADTPKYFPAKDKYPEIECERCKFLEGELRAVETKIGIENIFEQGKAQGRADAVAAERREINDWIDARAREENGATITMPNAIVEERINILCSIVVAAERGKWMMYEREYILPCFTWAKEYGIDLDKLVKEQSGKNCVELLVRSLAAAERERCEQAIMKIPFMDSQGGGPLVYRKDVMTAIRATPSEPQICTNCENEATQKERA